MSEIDFLVNVRRIILSAVALLDKRIEFLRCMPTVIYDKQTATTDEPQ
jgi:hypothetical protein